MAMHIVAKFISAVCLALELGFPRILQQWMRGPWWEWTPHSCWHCGCLSTAHTKREVVSMTLAILRRQGAASNSVAPDPFLNDRVSSEGWVLTPLGVSTWSTGRWEGKQIGVASLLVDSGWRNPLKYWFRGRAFKVKNVYIFYWSLFELCPALICDLYFIVVFIVVVVGLKKNIQ